MEEMVSVDVDGVVVAAGLAGAAGVAGVADTVGAPETDVGVAGVAGVAGIAGVVPDGVVVACPEPVEGVEVLVNGVVVATFF